MRFASSVCVVCAVLAAGAVADARSMPSPREPPVDRTRGDFWRDVIEPHADELGVILRRAREDINNADGSVAGDYDPLGQRRLASFHDAYGMLRYAHKLSPQNTDVLALLGRAADELGKTRQAIDAYASYLQLVEPDKTDGEVAGRLGMIYLRLGELDAAIRYLRLGARPITTPVSAQIEVALATALVARGQMSDAIDLLVDALPANTGYYSAEASLVAFALAVLYDRDEQRSAAFETLDHMQTTMQTGYGQQVQQALAGMRFAPAEDVDYYNALFYESVGLYAEARAAWTIYAAIGDAPWRGRALDHVAALDEQRRTAKPIVVPTTPVPLLGPHSRIRRPNPPRMRP